MKSNNFAIPKNTSCKHVKIRINKYSMACYNVRKHIANKINFILQETSQNPKTNQKYLRRKDRIPKLAKVPKDIRKKKTNGKIQKRKIFLIIVQE